MDKLLIFKIGGKVVDNPQSLESFLEGFAALSVPKILVHGGGIIAEQLAKRLDIPTEMHQGRRITSAAMRDVVTMVYGGQINKSIVASLQRLGCDAIGLTGADGGIIRAKRRAPAPVDFGYVGDVTEIRSDLLVKFLELGLTPVLAPLSFDQEILNTNADSIASRLAEALSSHYLVHMMYCFEQTGVMLDLKDPESLIERLDLPYYKTLLQAGAFTAGMLPKLEECFRARQNGAQHIVIAEAAACLAHAEGKPFRGTRIEL
mgnify:CR=1 FL=1